MANNTNMLDINACIDWQDEEKALVKVLCIQTCGTAWKDEYEKLTGSSSLIRAISLMNNNYSNSSTNGTRWQNAHVNGLNKTNVDKEIEEQ